MQEEISENQKGYHSATSSFQNEEAEKDIPKGRNFLLIILVILTKFLSSDHLIQRSLIVLVNNIKRPSIVAVAVSLKSNFFFVFSMFMCHWTLLISNSFPAHFA